jgi:hypothetical protein
MKTISCPVSSGRVPLAIPRFVASYVSLLLVVILTTQYFAILGILALDFYIRGFAENRKSPLAFLSLLTYNFLKLNTKSIDRAPKIFAAKIGFAFSLTIFAVGISGFLLTANILLGVLLVFALLESVLGLCVGCYIYTYLYLPFKRNNF